MTFFTKSIKTLLLVLATAQVMNAQIFTEDFEAGIPANWTVDAVWAHGNTDEVSSQYFSPPEHSLFMIANDDALGGTADPIQILAYTDAIDLTTTSTGEAYLSFEAYFRNGDYQGDETARALVSVDGGNTWEEVANLGGDDNVWQVINADLTAYVGNEVLIAFEYNDGGSWNYGFAFDDVSVFAENPGLPVDLRTNTYYSMPSSMITPVDQEKEILLLADFQNIGIEDQEGVVLDVTIENAAGDVVHSDQIEFGTLQVDSLAENQLFAPFTPTEQGFYKGTYSISSTNDDLDPSNNSVSFNFIASDTTYANELYIEAATGTELDMFLGQATFINPAIFPADVPRQWGMGNIFNVKNGAGKFVRYVSAVFNAQSAACAGETITFSLYEWVDENSDNNPQASELVIAGITPYTLQGNEEGLTTVQFSDILTAEDVELKDNTTYILMWEYLNNSSDEATDVSLTVAAFDDEIFFGTYGATIDNTGELDLNSCIVYAEDNSGISGQDLSAFSVTGVTYSPVLRMSVGEQIITDNTVDLPSTFETKIFPLPAQDFVNLELIFEENVSDLNIQITSEEGKVLRSMDLNNVKNQTVEFNVSDLAKGVYFFNINTEFGSRAKLFIVQ